MKQQHVLPDPVRARMNVVEEECERAARIVRELLVFARRRPPERKRVDFNEVVRAALTLQSPEFTMNNIGVVAELSPIPHIWADAHQMQQVLLNLFRNATHAMKSTHGQGTLTVRSSGEGGEVTLEVEDDGPGIVAENLNRVFDPFFTTKGVGEGTGLGLSLSMGIVEAHGGTMHVENVAGAGARFALKLPLGEGGEGVVTSAAPQVEPASPTRRARILVVEDEAPLRALLTEVLRGLGHQVDEAATGQVAMKRLDQNAYDLITLDLKLPDTDGKAIWHWLRSRNPDLATRVMFMTGDTMRAETQKFLQDAGRPVMSKPLTIDQITRMVNEMLGAQPAN